MTELRSVITGLYRSLGFTLAVVLVLGFGLGTNTAIVSVVESTALRPLAYPHSEALMGIAAAVSLQQVAALSQLLKPAAHLGAFQVTRADVVHRGIIYRNLWGASVSADLFEVLGVGAAIGRVFSTDEDRKGDRVVVLGSRIWRETFSSDANILGQQLLVNNSNYTVIGVMPPDFEFPESITHDTDFWIPLGCSDLDDKAEVVHAVIRMRPGISREEVAAGLKLNTTATRPEDSSNVVLKPMTRGVPESLRLALGMSWGAAGLLLLFACTNVIALQLARATSRRHEVAIRLAVGASRTTILKRILLENIVLGAAGATLGILIARFCLASSEIWLPAGWIAADHIHMDTRVLMFAGAMALFTSTASGFAAAVPLLRGLDGVPALRESSDQFAGSWRNRPRRLLISVQTAVTFTLLVGSGLFVSTYQRLWAVPLGFKPDHLLVAGLLLPKDVYPIPDQWNAVLQRIRLSLAALPGVERVGGTNALPFWGYSTIELNPERNAPGRRQTSARAQATFVTPGYFPAMSISLLRGREFADTDFATAQPVVIVDKRLERKYWGDNGVGQRVWVNTGAREQAATIIGVVDEIHQLGFTEAAEPTVYLPYAQVPMPAITLVLRTRGRPLEQKQALFAALHELDPSILCYDVVSMDQVLGKAIAPQRAAMWILVGFAICAVLAATVGIYGFVSYTVKQRTREIGIRLAIGSQRFQAVFSILRQTIVPVIGGIGLGWIAALLLSRLARGLLFGVSATDPVIFGLTAGCLLSLSGIAALSAALQAASIDPVKALRHE